MKKVLLTILLLSSLNSAIGQDKKVIYSKARIYLSNQNTIKKLAGLGVETDHGDFKPGQYFTSGFSENELNRIKTAGFEYNHDFQQ